MLTPTESFVMVEPTTGVTLMQMFDDNAARHADELAVSWLADGRQQHLTWGQYRDAVMDIASGLLGLGVEAGDVVAISASNRVEHLIADHAARRCGAAAVSLYTTLSPEQTQHVLADCSPKVLILEGGALLERFVSTAWACERETPVVVIDLPSSSTISWADLRLRGAAELDGRRSVLAERVASVGLDDTATVIYTSGTTGLPKGVVVTHRNLLWNVDAVVASASIDVPYLCVSYLPLAHIVERVWSIYLATRTAGHVFCCPDASQLLPALRAHRPTWFMAVPRVWEKLAAAAEVYAASPANEHRRDELAAARECVATLRALRVRGEAVSPELSHQAAAARNGILRDVRMSLGIERAFSSSGAAALRPETAEVFGSLGVDIVQGYGLTETSGPVVIEVTGAVPSPGSVGLPIKDCELRIAEDGEVLVRSPGNTPGYLNRPEATAELIDADGWLHTGDVGRIDHIGRLFITDRKKELIVTASGKNVSPQAIENVLSGRSFISHTVAVGEGRKFVAALITPDRELLARFANDHGIGGLSTQELIEHPLVLAEVAQQVDAVNARLSRAEQVKSWRLLASPFSVDDGTLTPTFKLKRRMVHQQYGAEIDSLYDRPSAATRLTVHIPSAPSVHTTLGDTRMTDVTIDVYTSPAIDLENGGIFSPTTSTLILGPKEAILVDTQFLPEHVEEVRRRIVDSGRRLTTIFITHAHSDHFFGLETLLAAFPDAQAVSTPAVAAAAKAGLEAEKKTSVDFFQGAAVENDVVPTALSGSTLSVDGEVVEVIELPQADISPTAALHVPSIGAVVAGDAIYNGVNPFLAVSGPAEWPRWIESIDVIAALEPSIVVAGHKRPELDDDPSTIQETRDYISAFIEGVDAQPDSRSLVAHMQALYPDYANPSALVLSAVTAFRRKKAAL